MTTKKPLFVIALIVLVDLVGFAIVMPMLGPLASEYGFSGLRIGLLFSAYPLCQLVAGPILGRLSDRYGRRPVLIFSQAGTAISFLILGLSRDFWIMLLARALDGASGGNILVAQAYVADVTTPENRARGMGLIGMSFGLGFVLGPLLAGLLLEFPIAPEWRLRLPFLVAAAFSTLAWILVLTWLPESRDIHQNAGTAARIATLAGVWHTLRTPKVGSLIAVASLVTLGFAAIEGTFSLYLSERLGWSARSAAFGFAFLGFVSAFVQGGLIRRLVPRLGEPRLILAGLAIVLLGYLGMTQVAGTGTLLAATLFVGLGQGLVSPSLNGLISRLTPAGDQGAVFGTLSSASTLTRMINYSVANVMLARWGPTAPFFEAASIATFALVVAVPTVAPWIAARHAAATTTRLDPFQVTPET